MSDNPSVRIKDGDLRTKGIDPIAIRRWFLKNHGITFHAHQRIFRINSAFKKLQNGEPVTTAAYDAGYESLSGFSDSFKSVFGLSPNNSRQQQVLDITRIETPIGPMLAGATNAGICLLEFTDRKMLETELKSLAKIYNAVVMQGSNPHFDVLKQQLTAYFEKSLTTFTVPLHAPGTAFQQTVWQALQQIPYGQTRSYKQQALICGQPQAIRAVANANGMNRISILIPCHRVIGDNGQLTGYGGGLWRKKWLLELEKENVK